MEEVKFGNFSRRRINKHLKEKEGNMKKIPMIMLMAAVAAVLMCNTAMAGRRMGVIKNGTFFYDTETKWNQGTTNAGNSGNLIGFLHWLPSGYQTNPKNDEDKDGEADKLREMEKPNNKAEVKTTKKKNIPEGRSIEDPTLLYGVDGEPVRWVKLKLKHNKTYGARYRLRYIPFEGIYGDGFNPNTVTNWKNVDGLQLDLSGADPNKYYYLEADVYIDKHTLEDSGWYAGNEWPITIAIGHVDADNGKRRHLWGFLDGVDTQGINPYTQIANKTWYHYRSEEITSLYETRPGESATVYPIDRIYGVSVTCEGWDAEVRIANVDIYEYDSAQTSSPDDQVYPSLLS